MQFRSKIYKLSVMTCLFSHNLYLSGYLRFIYKALSASFFKLLWCQAHKWNTPCTKPQHKCEENKVLSMNCVYKFVCACVCATGAISLTLTYLYPSIWWDIKTIVLCHFNSLNSNSQMTLHDPSYPSVSWHTAWNPLLQYCKMALQKGFWQTTDLCAMYVVPATKACYATFVSINMSDCNSYLPCMLQQLTERLFRSKC